MTAEAEAGTPDLVPAFDLGLDELRPYGIRVPPEQECLLIPGSAEYVMVATPLCDPFSLADGLYKPLEVEDVHGERSHVVVPAIGWVDWPAVGRSLEDEVAPDLFPSVPVEIERPETPHGCDVSPAMERIWNCWPVGSADVDDVRAAGSLAVHYTAYALIDAVAICYQNNDVDPCAFIPTLPEHEPHRALEHGETCVSGERWLEEARTALFWDSQITDWPGRVRSFGYSVQLPAHLQEVWELLVASSQANTFRSLTVVPPWEREGLRQAERHYSPWYLSSS